ncbi:ABC transporter [Ornatilinea apprima]|uniref:ABC transporter n=1 Tax=Ornatilinea apprima TaxID=1134406 RepID=A0A0N8GNE7_9CHLR|nr:carbohydrate ABC transporter permease [Ornatilinea apprima]KPL77890.1 ABC transporter [Ornatilinea apprima]
MSTTTVQPKRKKSFFEGGREDSPFKRLLIHMALLAYCVITVYPLLRIFTVSIRPGNRLLSTDLAIIPADATLESYRIVLLEKPLLQWLWNSLAITAATAVIGVILAATSAYAFSRFKFPGRSLGLVFLLTTQMIPSAMLMVPIYILAIQMDLVGTYRGLVVAYSVTSIPFSIWILKGYYDTIPIDLEEAARIDGCTELEAFWRILLPLSAPALAIVFLFNFTQAWNDYLLARVMLGAQETLLTWPLGLQRLQGQFTTLWGQFSAGAILVTIPVMVLFLYTSKYLISGLTLGSVKG